MELREKKCFVCGQSFPESEVTLNTTVNLYVCSVCNETEKEKQKVAELLDSLADGFVCGCI